MKMTKALCSLLALMSVLMFAIGCDTTCNNNSTSQSSYLTIKDGVLIRCDTAATGIIEIPAGVTTIEEKAFLNCGNITGVIIPQSVKNIKNYSFLGCTSLADVYYESSKSNWQKITIGKTAFDNIDSLTIHYNNDDIDSGNGDNKDDDSDSGNGDNKDDDSDSGNGDNNDDDSDSGNGGNGDNNDDDSDSGNGGNGDNNDDDSDSGNGGNGDNKDDDSDSGNGGNNNPSDTAHTITFDSDGGSDVDSQTIEHGKTATKPTAPTKKDYTFIGWYYNDSEFDFGTPIENDITLTAKWTINKYTITFDSDGGSDVDSQTIEHGKTATKPDDPTKKDYTFIGWYYNDNEFDFGTPIESNITLTARWLINGNITVTVPQNSDIKLTVLKDGTTVNLTAETGYTDYTWRLDGKVIDDEKSNTLTCDTSGWTKGKYEVTVEAQKNGEWYSATVYITVGGNR